MAHEPLRGWGNPHVAGNPVGGTAAFVGREDVTRAVVRALAEPLNQGIVLYGQRRIGKTSILQHLMVTLPERTGHRPVWFDLQDKAASSLDEILADLASAITGALGLPEPAPGPDVEAWFRDTWLPGVLDGLAEGVSLVLLFDEFDVLADLQAKQDALFPYLRRLLGKNAPRLCAVFVISRTIDDLKNGAHALLKGFPAYHVSLLARKDAEALVRLAEKNGSLTWSDEAVETAWALTHGHPLLLQMLCSHVWTHVHEERRPEDAAQAVTAAEVEEAVEPTLTGTRAAFEWLWKQLPLAKRLVAAALALAGPEAISEEALLLVLKKNGVRLITRELREAPQELIEWDVLEAPRDGLFQFRVELLRRWINRFKPIGRTQQDLNEIEPIADLLYRAGEGLAGSGHVEPAIARLKEALEFNPGHVLASDLLAEIHISREESTEARAVLERLYQNHPAAARVKLVQVVLTQAEAAQEEDEQLALFQRAREIENKNAAAIAGIQQIWKARGDKARADGDLQGALAAYRAGDLTELVAEVDHELREQAVAAGLAELYRLEAGEHYSEALERVRLMASTYGSVRDWQPDLDRLTIAVAIHDAYTRGIQALGAGDKEAAKQAFASVIARRSDYKDAVSLLHALVTGVPFGTNGNREGRIPTTASTAGGVTTTLNTQNPCVVERRPVRLFFSYSHADHQYRTRLEQHLSSLRLEGSIETWHDQKIIPGDDWKSSIGLAMREADIILLLISADFLHSDFCVNVELAHAIERHERGVARVIPIAVRLVDWGELPISKLEPLPRDRKPVASWGDQDEAWFQVAYEIRQIVRKFRQ